MRKIRDILIGFIVICMVITLIPIDAFASETPVVENEQTIDGGEQQKAPEQPEDDVDKEEIN